MSTAKKEKAIEPVTAEVITHLLKDESDFSFEMKVLNEMSRICPEGHYDHSGTYSDPVTSVLRQFDIRATVKKARFSAFLAIECKNISTSRPLIVHATKRRKSEAWHCVIVDRGTQTKFSSRDLITHLEANSYGTSATRILRLDCQSWTPYQTHELVGKNVDQVLDKGDGTRKIGDQDFFQKYSQAINSCFDLIVQARKLQTPCISSVLPVLVIPDDALWQITYAENGAVEGAPVLASRIPYYIDQTWDVGKSKGPWYKFPISHLEIVTFSELENFMKLRILGNEERAVGNIFNGLLG